ncbi:MAG: hypothetical protein PWR17_790 [Candidatus Methanomethylophilaceae archaeon]|nr:hypothetical protein [Candidatus Methanomethylophilaceae archaeon]
MSACDIIATLRTAKDIIAPAIPVTSKTTPEASYPMRYSPSPINAMAADVKNATWATCVPCFMST